jgi:hypothetical protein
MSFLYIYIFPFLESKWVHLAGVRADMQVLQRLQAAVTQLATYLARHRVCTWKDPDKCSSLGLMAIWPRRSL